VKCPLVPISIGELLDKITILQIKSEKTDNEFVHKELNDLIKIAEDIGFYNQSYLNDLLDVNRKLWDIEDRLRDLEKIQKFDNEFIDLARQVYITNDKRAEIKRKINQDTQSNYQEIKLYS
jgi:predicted  nucleic acid-binding Zn-ribbon protein